MAEKGKKTFEFRMSKKVAELTQVVHMLFTRNHEKEVELEAQKEAYEYEIELVMRDATIRIEKLDMQLREHERNKFSDGEQARVRYESEMKGREEELLKKLAEKEHELVEEKSECQNVRDLLINAQKDIEQLRSGASSELNSKSEEVANKSKELEKLKKSLEKTERKFKELERKSEETIKDLTAENERLQNELAQLQELFEDNRRTKEQLIAQNKQLESEVKKVRRELGKRFTEMVTNQNMRGRGLAMDYNSEMERLRKEVQRYKLELSNRDNNFNRVFTEFQPMVVDSRAGKIATQQQQLMQNSSLPLATPMQPHSHRPLGREKTFAYANSHSYEDEPAMFFHNRSASSLSLSTSSSRLPTLPAPYDRNSKVSRLVKPRPLSKELLSGKN